MGVDSVGKDIHDLWKDVCLSYIQQERPKNPDLASEMVGAVLFYESEAYRKSGKPPLNHHDTAAYHQQPLELFKNTLSDIAKLGSFDWTPNV